MANSCLFHCRTVPLLLKCRFNYSWLPPSFLLLLLQGVCDIREPLRHPGRAGPSPLHCSRRPGHYTTLPSTQVQQAHRVRRVTHPRQVGDGAHRHYHEAQARRWPVRRGVRGHVEEVQPHSRCQNTQGVRSPPKYKTFILISSLSANEGT